MSAEHRKPVMAFVALAIIAAALVGVQRADARGGEILAAVIGVGVHVEGILPEPVEVLDDPVVAPFGSALLVLADAPVEAAGATVTPTAVAGRESAAAPREVTSRPRDGKPTSTGARKAVKPRAAEKKRPSTRFSRVQQAPARPRAASTTLRVATATSTSVHGSTASRVGRGPQARSALATQRLDRPRRAVAPGKRWRSEHRRGTHRPARQARMHRMARR